MDVNEATDKYSGESIPESEKIPSSSFKPLAAPGKLHGTSLPDATLLRENPMLGAEDMMRLFVASRVPVTLWGPVGAGKTKTIQAFSREKDENGTPYQVMTIQPSTEDPTALHGLMFSEKDHVTQKTIMRRSIPSPAEEVWTYYLKTRGLTVMFLDEMTTCMPAQQNALLGMLTDGTYGDMDISPYVTFIMAANPPGTVQTCLELSEAIINRGGHIAWFGDVGPWLDNWESGFGYDSRKPTDDITWAIRTLVDQAPEHAFRDEPIDDEGNSLEQRWKISELCPYDQMQMSPRSLDEFAKMSTVINNSFSESPDDVRHFYLQSAATAMLGPQWGKRQAVVNLMELDRVNFRKAVATVRSHGGMDIVNWSYDKLRSELRDTMYFIGKTRMTTEKISQMYDQLFEQITKQSDDGSGEPVFSPIHMVTAWAFFATSPTEAAMRAAAPMFLRFVKEGNRLLKTGAARRATVLPNFANDEMVKRVLNDALD